MQKRIKRSNHLCNNYPRCILHPFDDPNEGLSEFARLAHAVQRVARVEDRLSVHIEATEPVHLLSYLQLLVELKLFHAKRVEVIYVDFREGKLFAPLRGGLLLSLVRLLARGLVDLTILHHFSLLYVFDCFGSRREDLLDVCPHGN